MISAIIIIIIFLAYRWYRNANKNPLSLYRGRSMFFDNIIKQSEANDIKGLKRLLMLPIVSFGDKLRFPNLPQGLEKDVQNCLIRPEVVGIVASMYFAHLRGYVKSNLLYDMNILRLIDETESDFEDEFDNAFSDEYMYCEFLPQDDILYVENLAYRLCNNICSKALPSYFMTFEHLKTTRQILLAHANNWCAYSVASSCNILVKLKEM